MTRLGIEDPDYQKYEEMFLRTKEKHHYLLKTSDSWTELKHPWTGNLILKHLTGEQTVGLFPADSIDYLMIDIDRHNRENNANIQSRIRQVEELFDGDPLVYQSSFSGGIRLCYFLENAVQQEMLHQRCKEIFRQNNYPMQPGVIEILASKKGDRLPFGEGSYLVESFNLEPIYHLTLKDTLSIAYECFQHHKIELSFEIQSASEELVLACQGMSVFDATLNRLYEEGLHPGVTTNDALLKLSWDLHVRKGYSKPETEKFIINWIRSKHNGVSNRFNAGKVEQIIAQIQRIVARTDSSKAGFTGSRYALRKKKLSLNDVRKILPLTEEPRLRLAIFSLLEYCLCFGKKAQSKNEGNTLISNIYVSGKGDVTYRSGFTKDFYCAISKKTLQHLPGFDKAYPQKTLQKIIKLRVLSLKREAHPESHNCRQFWVHFSFDDSIPIKVVSLDEGLLKLKQLDRDMLGPMH
jgi:hypothetical protein